MRLTLRGHDYKYAVEQTMLLLFPGEHPEYGDATDADATAVVSLTHGGVYATAVTRLATGAGSARGTARVKRAQLERKLVTDRLLQRIIKLSFYRAAVQLIERPPDWGALTGIRPAKMFTGLVEDGLSVARASRVFAEEYHVSPERISLCADASSAAIAVKRTLSRRAAGVYIGIPFCPTRCAYCSFVSQSVEKSMNLIEPFLDVLLDEISSVSKAARELGLDITSVYIGGGTPTTLSPDQLDRVLTALRSSFDLSGMREFTVEAGRPDTITDEKLAVLRGHGVNRISVNPQTLSDRVLDIIGRRHTAADVFAAIDASRRAGFSALNTDLIAGLPGDSLDGFISTLDGILSAQPENITIHTLALKRAARETMSGKDIPSGDEVRRMLDYASAALRGAGYFPYYLYRQKYTSGGFENVGWSRPGHEGLYNILMMEELCTVLALGGGASTKLVSPAVGRIERIFNPKYPYEYIASSAKTADRIARIKAFYATEEQNGL